MRLIDADALAAHKFKNDISYNSFCSLIKRQPTVGEWIDIKSGHPELREDKYEDLTFMISKPVLGYNAETGVMEVVLYEEDHEAPEFIGYISQFGDGFPITHWMPLPEPPEKSK